MGQSAGHSDRGAETVEFALILSLVLLPLLTALITFGFAFTAQINITQAAREGARFAAICDQDVTCLGVNSSNVKSKVEGGAGITISDAQITVTPCPAPTTPPDPQRQATVVIKYTSGVGIPPFATLGLTLTGKASTPCGG